MWNIDPIDPSPEPDAVYCSMKRRTVTPITNQEHYTPTFGVVKVFDSHQCLTHIHPTISTSETSFAKNDKIA